MTFQAQRNLLAAVTEEPDWFTAHREQAATDFERLALPIIERVKFHRWQLFDDTWYTDSPRDPKGFGVLPQLNQDEPFLIQYGTHTTFAQLPQALIDQGVVLMDLFEALHTYPELVRRYFMTQAVKCDEDKLTAFHAMAVNSGVFVYIPKNVVVEQPLQTLLIQDSSVSEAFVKHVLLVADCNSSVQYVEKIETLGKQRNTANIVVEVIAEDGAQVKYAAMDRLGGATDAYINRRGHLKKDAHIDWAIGVLNDGNVIADFDSDLVGKGSHSNIKVVAVSTGRQVQGIDTRVTNFAPYSIGHILQHGVILDRATLTFNGIGHIIRGANGSDAQQESRVLMLSDQARGDANPILLIDEHDVTAGHAASVGQVDAEQMFYLTSRGIPQRDAERLVIRGFLGSVIAAIPVAAVREELIAVIDGKLAMMDD